MPVDDRDQFGRGLVLTCVFLCFVGTLNTQAFGLLLARVAGTTGLSIAAMGGLRTLENAATIGVALVISPHVDHYPRRWPLAAGLGFGLAAALTLVAVPSTLGAAAYFWLNGMAVMLSVSTVLAIPSDFVSGRRLTRTMGMVIAGFSLSDILFLPLAGRLADRYGWRSAFLLSSAFLVCGLLVALAVAPREQPRSGIRVSRPASRYAELVANRRLLFMLGSALLRFAQFGALVTFLSAVLIERFELSVSRIGTVFALLGLMSILGSVSSGFFLHSGRLRWSLVHGGVIIAAAAAVALWLEVRVVATVIVVTLIMFGLAVQENASTVTVIDLSPEKSGAAMSLNELSAAAGALVGIGLGSIGIALYGTRGFGAVVTLLALAGALVTWRVLRPQAIAEEARSDAASTGISRERPL